MKPNHSDKFQSEIIKIKMKKIKDKNKLPKFEFGSLIDNPATDLYENQISMAKAMNKGSKNPWANAFNIFGGLAQQVGGSMMEKGIANGDGADGKGITGFLNKNSGSINSGMNLLSAFSQMMAYGGGVNNKAVEVEGEEVGETPNGELLNFQGPSHEKGGIPIALPEGTEIYSKRIRVDGVSMADRKKNREKKSMTLESLFEKNSTDALLKNSLSRTKDNNQVEEDADNKIQAVVKQLLEGNTDKHAWGTPIGPNKFPKPVDFNAGFLPDYVAAPDLTGLYGNGLEIDPSLEDNGYSNKDIVPGAVTNPATKTPNSKFNLNDVFGNITPGDTIGMVGNLISTFGPMRNTKENRATDTPNINAFKDYGKDGLAVLDTSKKYVNQVREQKLKDLELARTGAVKRNSNSARGINTVRALNLASDAGINNAQEETYNSFAEQMMAILGQEAGMENQQDSMVMQGEQARDLADRQDKDNYYTQLGQDIATKGTGLQEIGKDVNSMKQRKVMENLLNQLSMYGITIDSKGNLSNPKTK